MHLFKLHRVGHEGQFHPATTGILQDKHQFSSSYRHNDLLTSTVLRQTSAYFEKFRYSLVSAGSLGQMQMPEQDGDCRHLLENVRIWSRVMVGALELPEIAGVTDIS